jgi:hypothetical protein
MGEATEEVGSNAQEDYYQLLGVTREATQAHAFLALAPALVLPPAVVLALLLIAFPSPMLLDLSTVPIAPALAYCHYPATLLWRIPTLPSPTQQEIKRAYRKTALRLHPDHNCTIPHLSPPLLYPLHLCSSDLRVDLLLPQYCLHPPSPAAARDATEQFQNLAKVS